MFSDISTRNRFESLWINPSEEHKDESCYCNHWSVTDLCDHCKETIRLEKISERKKKKTSFYKTLRRNIEYINFKKQTKNKKFVPQVIQNRCQDEEESYTKRRRLNRRANREAAKEAAEKLNEVRKAAKEAADTAERSGQNRTRAKAPEAKGCESASTTDPAEEEADDVPPTDKDVDENTDVLEQTDVPNSGGDPEKRDDLSDDTHEAEEPKMDPFDLIWDIIEELVNAATGSEMTFKEMHCWLEEKTKNQDDYRIQITSNFLLNHCYICESKNIANQINHFFKSHLFKQIFFSKHESDYSYLNKTPEKPCRTSFYQRFNKRKQKSWKSKNGMLEISPDFMEKSLATAELIETLDFLSNDNTVSYKTKLKQKISRKLSKKYKIKTKNDRKISTSITWVNSIGKRKVIFVGEWGQINPWKK